MSTVVFVDGEFAADSQVSQETLYIGSNSRKVGIIGKYAYGMVGGVHDLSELIKWLKKGGPDSIDEDVRDYPGFSLDQSEAIVATRTNDGFKLYYLSNNGISEDPWQHPFQAIGSGAELAIGALEAGATPTQAIEIACKYDAYSSLPVNTAKVPF
jgi:20S proteasome alpha/beta subunit